MEIPSIEVKDHKFIEQYQVKALSQLLTYVNSKSTFYKTLFKRHNIEISEIKSLEDLRNIPPTTKSDLQKYSKDFWCVGAEDIVEYCSTSGTEGEAVTVPLTHKDIDRLAYNEAISLACAKGDQHSIYQLTTTIDRQFMAGLAYALGARKLGAGMVRIGPGLPQLQWKAINELHPTALIVVPSFLLKLIEYAEQHKIDLKNSSVKRAICIGEPIRHQDFSLNAIGKRITDKWDIELYSTYASSEMAAAFTECSQFAGGHMHPELIIIEVLDDNNEPVGPDVAGEITITTLGVEAMPLIRFKTGDIARIHYSACPCGRTTPRIGPVIGRKNQLIKYKGTSCYPPALFNVMDNINGIDHYQVVLSSDDYGNDAIEVRYAVSEKISQKVIEDQFRVALRVVPRLVLMDQHELVSLIFPKTHRKPRKFLDERQRVGSV